VKVVIRTVARQALSVAAVLAVVIPARAIAEHFDLRLFARRRDDEAVVCEFGAALRATCRVPARLATPNTADRF
jgi:hypothetical protein